MNYDKLMSEVAYPNWNQAILPMTRFRGHSNVHRWRAQFLCVYTMFLDESPSFSAGRKLLARDELYHICGRHSLPDKISLLGTIGRVLQIPSLVGRYTGFKDYLYYLTPNGWDITPVGIGGAPRKDEVLQYPYIQGKPRSEHEMLLAVHRLIPTRLDPDFRGEICQDIFVDLLSGKTNQITFHAISRLHVNICQI
jgi:hypothetical protein